nr:hypothetical protein [Tanacetum cinerariifolium]
MEILLLRHQQDDPHKALMDKGIVDSGFSRHMTGNKAYLADYQEFKGGYVAFGVENQANKSVGPKEANNNAGTQANDDQGANLEEIDLNEEHFVLRIWSTYSTIVKSSGDKIKKNTGFKTCENPISQVEQVYRNNKDERGVVVRNKAPLVTQGHRQEEGIDYDEVFALVAKIKAIRIFLAFASYMGFIVYQMDVKSDFLYGTIDEEVAWYATLSTFLEKNRCRRGAIDKTLFIKQDKKDITLVQVYVDDIIFSSTKKSWCDEFEELMKNRFQMSSMGELTFFLRLQTASTPIKTQKPLVKDEEAANVDVHLYRFQVNPKTSHLQFVKRIF